MKASNLAGKISKALLISKQKNILVLIAFFCLLFSNFACRDNRQGIFAFTAIGPTSEKNYFSWMATGQDYTHTRLDTLFFNTTPIFLWITIDDYRKGKAEIELISEEGISLYQKAFDDNISVRDTLVTGIPQRVVTNLNSFTGRLSILIDTK